MGDNFFCARPCEKLLFHLLIWLIICLDSKSRSKIIFHGTLKAWFCFIFDFKVAVEKSETIQIACFFSTSHFPEILQYCALLWKSFHSLRWMLINLLWVLKPDSSVLGVFLFLSMWFFSFKISFVFFWDSIIWLNFKIKSLKFYLSYLSSILLLVTLSGDFLIFILQPFYLVLFLLLYF